MGRTVLLLMVLATTLLMTSGVAWAAVSEVGGPGGDAIVGTEGDDALAGGGGSDRVSGVGGDDFMDGGPPATPTTPPAREAPPNADLMLGGEGEDDIDGNLGPDRIVGGPGDDLLADGEQGGRRGRPADGRLRRRRVVAGQRTGGERRCLLRTGKRCRLRGSHRRCGRLREGAVPSAHPRGLPIKNRGWLNGRLS